MRFVHPHSEGILDALHEQILANALQLFPNKQIRHFPFLPLFYKLGEGAEAAVNHNFN